jgi:putative MATE family efflux protein
MQSRRDLRTGPIPGHFRALAVPAAIGMVFATLYNVVDVYYAGLLSTGEQAGLAITFQIFFILVAFGAGLGSAMGALIGNSLGSDDLGSAKRTACQGLVFGAIVSVVLGVSGIWGSPTLLAIISEPGSARDAANAYMNLLLFATAPFLLAFCANGILGALGDTQSMKRAQIAAFFANVALNPLFIFGIPGVTGGFGFNGIALSTVVSQSGVMAYLLLQVSRSSLMAHDAPAVWKPLPADFREITGQALPATFAWMVLLIAGFVVQYHLKSFGTAAQAAYGIALRIEQLILLPGLALTNALLPIAAQCYGARDFDRMCEAFWFCVKAGTGMMLIGAVALWVLARPMMALFTDDPDVIRLGGDYLHVDGFILPVYLALFALNSLLQALKRPGITVWIGLYRQAFAVAFFTWLLVAVFGLGTWGVWFGIAIAVVTGFAVALAVTEWISRPLMGGVLRVRRGPALAGAE